MEAHDSTLETIGIQEPQLPPSQRASSTHTILNATPSGEVQFRTSNGGEIEKDSQRTASESSSRSTFRNYLPHLQLSHLMKQVDMLTSIDQQIPSNIQEAV
ncbi:hypothetical protein ACJMK2_018112 [Sinanodonta woodiana]|uniref:Uncharacterized protein n=1 Tax=Sinanodonta woodiana TaxID=1069815 RepID=A0ABD3UCF0_SINWO